MNNRFNNPEIKYLFVIILLINSIIGLVIYVYMSNQMKDIKDGIVAQNTALVGRVLKLEPGLINDVEGIMTGRGTAEERKIGEDALGKYGYGKDSDFVYLPYINVLTTFPSFYALLIILSGSIIMFFLISFLFESMYRKIRKTSENARMVADGIYDKDVDAEYEGDLGLMQHNFQKMTGKLKYTIEQLESERVFLQNTISDISHQLKTPLTSLLTFNEILLGDEDISPETRKDFLARSNTQLERMEWLIISLLKMAKLESGFIKFSKEEFYAISAVRSAIDMLSPMIEEKSIEIICEENETSIKADEAWILEAMVNIIKNAIEHSNSGGRIKIEMEETELLSCIKISDNGEGIDEKDLPNIFERFYVSASASASASKSSSVGIGLYLAKIIIEGNGGSICARSSKGRGEGAGTAAGASAGTEFEISFLKCVV